MIGTYILQQPLNARGKYAILRRSVNGCYHAFCECHTQATAQIILQALMADEFGSKFMQVAREAAE